MVQTHISSCATETFNLTCFKNMMFSCSFYFIHLFTTLRAMAFTVSLPEQTKGRKKKKKKKDSPPGALYTICTLTPKVL
jgi:hypothetical protein